MACAVFGLALAPGQDAQSDTRETEPAQAQTESGEQEALVLLRDGRRYEGVLVESTDESVTIRIANVDTTFDRDDVARVSLLPSAAERFRALRATTDDDDADALLALARWARDRGLLDEALGAVDEVLEIRPRDPEAVKLRNWIMQTRSLRRGTPDSRPATTPDEPARADEEDRLPVLTDEDVNLIRVYEINLPQDPRVVIDLKTINDFMAAYSADDRIPQDDAGREAFTRRPPLEILELMFELRAREFYSRVRVLEDPDALARFRKHVAGRGGWLINSCAANRCHGGEDAAGNLRLINRNANDTNVLYTNFYIIDQFRLADGTPLINHDAPERSALLTMGLPRERTRSPHPAVPRVRGARDWLPTFRTETDRTYERSVEFIRALYRPRPDYGITYPPEPESDEGKLPRPSR